MALELEGGEDPDKVGTAIMSLKNEHQNILVEKDKISVLFDLADEQYAAMILSKQKKLKSKDKGVVCEALLEAMYK